MVEYLDASGVRSARGVEVVITRRNLLELGASHTRAQSLELMQRHRFLSAMTLSKTRSGKNQSAEGSQYVTGSLLNMSWFLLDSLRLTGSLRI